MSKRKSLMLACAAVAAAAITTSCGSTPQQSSASSSQAASSDTSQPVSSDTAAENESGVFQADGGHVKPLGRTLFEDGLLWCAFSGSGAEFVFNGTKCEITIKGDSISEKPANDGNYARVGIMVNGDRVIDDVIDSPEKTYTVFQSETASEAVITVVKLSETAMSCMAIKQITAAGGGIKPTANKDVFIEFVGDSITCGYGVDDENRNHSFSTATEDVTKAYAYKTAQALDADYSMVSISGYGIISGYTDSGTKQPSQTVPKYYTKLGFSYGEFEGGKPHTYQWDFSSRQPDIIVINLGTNDDSYCEGKEEKEAEYREGYVKFLKTVRENNPDAKIVCALGIMGDRLYPSVEKTVKEYSEETGDTNISTLRLDPQQQEDGYAADWHPTEKTHTKAAEKLTAYLKELLKA